MPDEVAAAYGARPKFGPDYILPAPYDPRLISAIPPAIAQAAMDTGVARKPIVDKDAYRSQLLSRRVRSGCAYWSMSTIGLRATPVSIAALATAGGIDEMSRGSNGTGMMYSGPNFGRVP